MSSPNHSCLTATMKNLPLISDISSIWNKMLFWYITWSEFPKSQTLQHFQIICLQVICSPNSYHAFTSRPSLDHFPFLPSIERGCFKKWTWTLAIGVWGLRGCVSGESSQSTLSRFFFRDIGKRGQTLIRTMKKFLWLSFNYALTSLKFTITHKLKYHQKCS